MKNARQWYRENRVQMLVVFAAAIFVSLPLGTDFVNAGQDTAASLSRIKAVSDALFWVFPIRLVPLPQTAYGYSASVFSADLFYLIPAILYKLGFTIRTAYKLTVIVFQFITAYIAYFVFREIAQDRWAGMTAGFLYVLCPCRIYSIYGAGHLGEMFAWTFLPLTVWGMVRLFLEKEYGHTAGILILGYSLVLLSWPVTFWGAVISFLVMFLLTMRESITKPMLLVLIKFGLGFGGINAWYLIPMIFRFRDASAVAPLLTEHIREYALYLNQYIKIFEFGGDRVNVWESGLTSAAAVSPGIAVIAVVVFYICNVFVTGKQDRKTNKLLTTAGIMMILSSNLVPWDLMQNKNLLFSIILGALQTPAKLAVIADILLITGVAVVFARMPKSAEVGRYAGAVCLTGFLTAQFQVGRLLTTKGFIRDDQILEWSQIGYGVIAQESFFWRISEVITLATVAGIVVWRMTGHAGEAENGR